MNNIPITNPLPCKFCAKRPVIYVEPDKYIWKVAVSHNNGDCLMNSSEDENAFFIKMGGTDLQHTIAAAIYEWNILMRTARSTSTTKGLRDGVDAVVLESDRCTKCDGCGQIAYSEGQEPWSYWENLPTQCRAAVECGIIKPITCPKCNGTGKETSNDQD